MSDDDLIIDFTDQPSYGGGFEPVPRNWYNCVVSDWESSEVKKVDGKFPQGTTGTRWELTIDDGEFENRKLWINHWHHPKSVPFLKTFLQATGKFSELELNGRLHPDDFRERALNSTLQARAVIKEASGGYDRTNEVKSVKAAGADTSSGSNSTGLLP
jgi:hypothetical protein